MRVMLAYGTSGLAVEVPDDAVVVEPVEPPALADESGAIRQALPEPFSPARRWLQLVRGGPPGGGGVSRPHPPHAQHHRAPAPAGTSSSRPAPGPSSVELLCATGTHRQATPAEMAELVGARHRGSLPDTRPRLERPATTSRWERWTVSRCCSTAVTSRPTSGSSPDSWNRTSSPGGAGGPRGSAPVWPATETILEAHSPARIGRRPVDRG